MPWSKPKTIRVSSVKASHKVEKGRKTPARFLDEPIYVKRGLFGGYKVHDGNHRLARAAKAGRGTIRARVWEA